MPRYVLRNNGNTNTYSDAAQCLADVQKFGLKNIATRTESGQETSMSVESLVKAASSEPGWKYPTYLFWFEKAKFL